MRFEVQAADDRPMHPIVLPALMLIVGAMVGMFCGVQVSAAVPPATHSVQVDQGD